MSQLSAQEFANKQLEIIAGRPGYAVARTEVGEDILNTTKKMYEFSGDLSKTLIPFQESSKVIDDFTKQIVSAGSEFVDVLNGKGNMAEVFEKLSKAGDEVSDFMEGRYKDTLELLSDKYKDTAEEFERLKSKWTSTNLPSPTTNAKDVEISANGQNIKLLPEDTLYAGTSPQSLAYRMMEVMNVNKKNETPMPMSSTLDVNHRVSFDNLPPYITANDLSRHVEIALNENLSLQQGIISALARTAENYGTT
jgi:hypothetical protein